MKKIIFVVIVLISGISSIDIWAQVERTPASINEEKMEAREARMNHFLDSVPLEPEQFSKLLHYTGSLRNRYEAILRAQADL